MATKRARFSNKQFFCRRTKKTHLILLNRQDKLISNWNECVLYFTQFEKCCFFLVCLMVARQSQCDVKRQLNTCFGHDRLLKPQRSYVSQRTRFWVFLAFASALLLLHKIPHVLNIMCIGALLWYAHAIEGGFSLLHVSNPAT